MSTWKLISGILSIVLFAFVTFQSCAAGLYDSLAETGQASGSAGIVVAIILLVGGIVSVVTRNNTPKGADIALAILFALGAIVGFALAGSYGDLRIWAAWCAICAVTAIVSCVSNNKSVA